MDYTGGYTVSPIFNNKLHLRFYLTKYLVSTFSSFLDRSTYIGFFVLWLMDLVLLAPSILLILMSASIYIGTFLYINAMVNDLKGRLAAIVTNEPDKQQPTPDKIWPIYIQQIELHIDIIG